MAVCKQRTAVYCIIIECLDMNCCLQPGWRCGALITGSGGSSGGGGSNGSAAVEAMATMRAAAATPYYSCACSPMSTDAGRPATQDVLSCPCRTAYGIKPGNEGYFAAKAHYVRVCSHCAYPPELACDL